jgi:hypothetical protein
MGASSAAAAQSLSAGAGLLSSRGICRLPASPSVATERDATRCICACICKNIGTVGSTEIGCLPVRRRRRPRWPTRGVGGTSRSRQGNVRVIRSCGRACRINPAGWRRRSPSVGYGPCRRTVRFCQLWAPSGAWPHTSSIRSVSGRIQVVTADGTELEGRSGRDHLTATRPRRLGGRRRAGRRDRLARRVGLGKQAGGVNGGSLFVAHRVHHEAGRQVRRPA